MKIKKLADYQYEELQKGVLFINEYDLDLKYQYELDIYWKEFFFDVMEKIADKRDFYVKTSEDGESLLDYFKRDYKFIIEEYNLDIDIRDYIELNDYIPYEEWIERMGNFIAFKGWDMYLISDVE